MSDVTLLRWAAERRVEVQLANQLQVTEDLTAALKEAMQYIPQRTVDCHGMKCR